MCLLLALSDQLHRVILVNSRPPIVSSSPDRRSLTRNPTLAHALEMPASPRLSLRRAVRKQWHDRMITLQKISQHSPRIWLLLTENVEMECCAPTLRIKFALANALRSMRSSHAAKPFTQTPAASLLCLRITHETDER